MANKIERLLFSRKRLMVDIKRQTDMIATFTAETTVPVMLSRKDALEDLWAEFKNNADAIENSRDWIGTDKFIEEGSACHELYLNALVSLLEIMPEQTDVLQQSLACMRRARPPAPRDELEQQHDQVQHNDADAMLSSTQHSTNGSNNQSTNGGVGLPATIKLPPLQIKTFTGNLIDWPEFKATCETTFTHLMDNVSRFRYLKSHLTGEPARLVKHLPLTDGSHDVAWELLKKRYNNERAIINANLRRLIELPAMRNETAEELKRMLDTANECVATINGYAIDTNSWAAILIFLLSARLDANSIKHWEEKLQGKRTIPEFSEFTDFLEIRINILETTACTFSSIDSQQRKQRVLFTSDMVKKCTICQDHTHFAYVCPKLTNKSENERMKFVQEKGLCVNCFHAHKVEDCTSRFSCKICKKRHNSVLHPSEIILNICTQSQSEEMSLNDVAIATELGIEQEELQACEMAQILTLSVNNSNQQCQTMLATAMIKIEHNNRILYARALIDQGSTANCVSIKILRALNLIETPVNIPISCLGGHVAYSVKSKTSFTMRSLINDKYAIKVPALVVPRITTVSSIPIQKEWTHLTDLSLADPQHHNSNRIDVLLGAATFAQILCSGVIKGKINEPIAQQTELGWILSGSAPKTSHEPLLPILTLTAHDEDLSVGLQRFWENEEIPKDKTLTPEEKKAEEFYTKTTKRCEDGRYMVKLPFKSGESSQMGESFFIAKRRFENMIKRFQPRPEFRMKYDACIQEYLDLDHMEEIYDKSQIKYYLPHHPVIKEASTTTKIRPVFDASCKTNANKSLNDELLIGPTIQPDLFSLMIRWRKNMFVITGDIEKMYRQIWIDHDDSKYHGILWQQPGSNDIKSYCLKTVTFGVASAPFLAIRTLHQIGEDIKSHAPQLSEKIQNNFYVDDFFDSSETIDEAKSIIRHMTSTLAEYGFPLRKWKANHERCLEELNINEKDISPSNMFKTLGVQWEANSDQFVFLQTEFKPAQEWTKRTVLSEICKLFDPIGWLAPCTILAKIFMQKLWLLQLTWDENLPIETTNEWMAIRHQFQVSCSVKVPRWIGLKSNAKHISLQGFADASEKAYACVIYFRVLYDDDSVACTLVTAKTRVAPLKKVTIPRLELNAAVLLASLMEKVKTALNMPNIQVVAWTDSAIVLHWLSSHPSRWKTYVAHRVSDIQQHVPSHRWRHIASAQNPADCASRGLTLSELEPFKLWWQGPDFLFKKESEWPERVFVKPPSTQTEEKTQNIMMHIKESEANPLLGRFSQYERMLRVTTWCLRWLERVRTGARINRPIEPQELQNMEIRLLRLVQNEAFATEIMQLKRTQPLPAKSTIRNLDPILDENGLMRVGGRLQLSQLSRDQKHPIILPPKHQVTTILIRDMHNDALHGGLAITLQKIRQKFWIVNAKKTTSSIIHKCMICFRFKKQLLTQKMGNLPSYRVQEALPFTWTGVDYAGYFMVKTSQRKNAPFTKAYVALFICLTTRAVHLELVSDLSSAQFMKALKRFIGRRGIPKRMFSDNAKNFTGAEQEIKRLHDQLLEQNDSDLNKILLKNRIEWSNIPARAPHFGGWESGVKLMKHHLKRILGSVRLCFEDFNTVIIEIEAVVNSRPLWSVPNSTEEYDALTPAHFLVFRALNTLPEPNNSHIPLNRLSQYQYLQRLLTDFWKIWSKEYLQTLQVRKKWFDVQPNVRPGQLVLVSEDNEIPTQWSLGQIINIHPGPDQLVRAVDVKCRSKILSRPIHKLSLLPIIDNEQHNIG